MYLYYNEIYLFVLSNYLVSKSTQEKNAKKRDSSTENLKEKIKGILYVLPIFPELAEENH